VSSNLLPMLGQAAALGRVFAPDEDSPGKPATAVLSYGMWLRHFGGDPRMIGKSVTLSGVPYEVVGIMPRAFSLPREVLPTLDGVLSGCHARSRRRRAAYVQWL
jgi:MacB-like periplasmic core domain